MALKTEILFVSLSLFRFAAVAAGASPPFRVRPDASEVRFTAVGSPSALKIKGSGARPTGSLQAGGTSLGGEVTIALNDFTTGISLRDHHMKEKYLEVGKPGFEKAVLTVKKLEKTCLDAGSECPFEGTLSLHGKTQPVAGKARSRKEGAALAVEAAFGLKLTDFGVAVPSFAGITVADQVNVEADLSLDPK